MMMSNFQLNPNAHEFVPTFIVHIEKNTSALIPIEKKPRKDSRKKENCSNAFRNNNRSRNDKKKGEKIETIIEHAEETLHKPTNSYISALLYPVLKPIPEDRDTAVSPTANKITAEGPSVVSVTRNRVETTVSTNAINKFKSRWMQLSQDIAERDKKQLDMEESLLKQGAGLKTEASKWHSILKVPLPPAAYYDLPTFQTPPSSSSSKQTLILDQANNINKNSQPILSKSSSLNSSLDQTWWESIEKGDFDGISKCIQQGIDWEIRYDTTKYESSNLLFPLDCNGLTILHLLAKCAHTTLCLERVLSSLPYLTRHIDLKDRVHKRTALHYACAEGRLEHCHLLVKYGTYASIAEKDKYGDTPLHIACKGNHFSIVTFLIEKMKKQEAIKINIRNKKGQTPFMLTSSHQILNLLLDYGADVTNKDENGCDIILVAVQANDTYRLRKCLFHNTFRSMMNQQLQQENILFGSSSGGGAINKASTKNLSPLHVAVSLGHRQCVEILLSSGYYPINTMEMINTQQLNYYTPLMCAFQQNQYAIVVLLLQNGAEYGNTNESQLTEIGMAMYYQHNELLFALSQYLKIGNGGSKRTINPFLPQRILTSSSQGKANPMKLFTVTNSSQEDNMHVVLRLVWNNIKKEFLEKVSMLTKVEKLQIKNQIRDQYLITFVIAIACGNIPLPKSFWVVLCSDHAFNNLQSFGLVEDWPVIQTNNSSIDNNNTTVNTIFDVFPKLAASIKRQMSVVSLTALRVQDCDLELILPTGQNGKPMKVLVHLSVVMENSSLLRELITSYYANCYVNDSTIHIQTSTIPAAFYDASIAQEFPEMKELLSIQFSNNAHFTFEYFNYLLEYWYTGWIECLSNYPSTQESTIFQLNSHQLVDMVLNVYPMAKQLGCPVRILTLCEDKLFNLYCEKNLTKENIEVIKAMINTTFPGRIRFLQMMEWFDTTERFWDTLPISAEDEFKFHFYLKNTDNNQMITAQDNMNMKTLDRMYCQIMQNERYSSYVPIISSATIPSSSVLSNNSSILEVSIQFEEVNDACYWSKLVNQHWCSKLLKMHNIANSMLSYLARFSHQPLDEMKTFESFLRHHINPVAKRNIVCDEYTIFTDMKKIGDSELYLAMNCLVAMPHTVITENTPASTEHEKYYQYLEEMESDEWSRTVQERATENTIVIQETQQQLLEAQVIPRVFSESIAFLQQRISLWSRPKYHDVILTTLPMHVYNQHNLNTWNEYRNTIGDDCYYVHQNVLFAHSEKLAAMIHFQTSQQIQEESDISRNRVVISVPTVSPVLLGVLLFYMYSGMINHEAIESYARTSNITASTTTPENSSSSSSTTSDLVVAQSMELYLQLAVLADEYLIPSLVKQSTLMIVQQLTMENVTTYYQQACEARLSLLQQITAYYLLRILNTSYFTPIEELINIEGMQQSVPNTTEDSVNEHTEEVYLSTESAAATTTIIAGDANETTRPMKYDTSKVQQNKQPMLSQELLDFLLYMMESIIM